MSTHLEEIKKSLQSQYKNLQPERLNDLHETLISPFVLPLKKHILEQAQNIVRDLHTLSLNKTYKQAVLSDKKWRHVQHTPSVLSSLDVHIDADDQLRIIEVNTNASLYLLSEQLYRHHQLKAFIDAKQKLKESFRHAFNNQEGLLVIADENLVQQGLQIDFYLFKNFFEQELGVSCEVVDVEDLELMGDQITYKQKTVDMVYNRYCDFYFDNHAALRTAYEKQKTLISPNPLGYALLADKNRMKRWTPTYLDQLGDFPHLKKAALPIFEAQSMEDLWSKRKKYFLKPANSFGSKAVYNGKSMTKKTFTEAVNGNYLVQESVPAPKVSFDLNGDVESFKYDLRFYFYEGDIQLAVARLYQGQLTNMKTQNGGLAPIDFS